MDKRWFVPVPAACGARGGRSGRSHSAREPAPQPPRATQRPGAGTQALTGPVRPVACARLALRPAPETVCTTKGGRVPRATPAWAWHALPVQAPPENYHRFVQRPQQGRRPLELALGLAAWRALLAFRSPTTPSSSLAQRAPPWSCTRFAVGSPGRLAPRSVGRFAVARAMFPADGAAGDPGAASARPSSGGLS